MSMMKSVLSKPLRRLILMGCGLALLFLCSLPGLPARSFGASRSESHVPVDATHSIKQAGRTTTAQAPKLGQAFQDLSVDGSIVIYDKNNDRFYEHNRDRNTTASFPASTFKILNALISLETGVIRDDVAVLTWDGVQREFPAGIETQTYVKRSKILQSGSIRFSLGKMGMNECRSLCSK